MKKPKVYIAGRITGLPKEEYLRNFNHAEQILKEFNCKVYNPARKGKKLAFFTKLLHHREPTWEEYMIYGLKHLLKCDTLYLLTNWRDSGGANIEYELAKNLKMQIIREQNYSLDI